MATKTISIDLEAYQHLRAARREAKESFSQVIKRAVWEENGKTCGSLLATIPSIEVAADDVIERLQSNQTADSPPDHPWS